MHEQRISKTYDYKDINGHLLFQVVRFEPKSFAQRRPFNNDFVWGLGEVEPILYRLPEVLQGIKDCEAIYICEGEKDADNLAALGFIATTPPMGAGKWRTSYTETLKGCREVVVIADKDDPGRAHAQAIAKNLSSAGICIKVLEMPDINDVVVKDISNWLTAGGEKQSLIKLIDQTPFWNPPEITAPATDLETQKLVEQFGEPYYLNKDGIVTTINESFWASLHQNEHIQLYEPDERTFYRYNQQNGLYSIISEDVIKQEIAARLLDVSRQQELPSLERKRTNSNLNNIVAHLKGISEKKNAFKRDNTIVHLANGIIVFKDNGEADFCSFSPNYCSRNQCPIPFNASATCERFLNELLYPAVTADDAILLQKYTGLCLLGNNLIQKFLILDGQPGRGKSTLALVIQNLVGQINVTELRTKHLNERFELFRYLKKNLLVGVDVPGQFLSEKGAYVIKGLVGGDWFDAEQKCGTGSFPFQGNFCILITSNSRLQIRLDGDTGAWKRRLLIVRLKLPLRIKRFLILMNF